MNKTISAVVAVVLLAGTNGYAQKALWANKSLQAITGQVPSAFSKTAALSVRSAKLIGARVSSAQISLANSSYVSSSALFSRVSQTGGFKALQEKDVQLLKAKFENLDDVVTAKVAPFAGYGGALLSEELPGMPAPLSDTTVASMTRLLDLQYYMQTHNNEFPHLFTVTSDGWLLPSDCLASREGNTAFLRVVDILVKDQLGQTSPAVVEQLVLLHAQASNPVPVKTVVEQLAAWQRAHNNTTQAPRLPKDVTEVSLRSDAETLWLTTEIRLLQLTPDADIPEVIKTAQVTQ